MLNFCLSILASNVLILVGQSRVLSKAGAGGGRQGESGVSERLQVPARVFAHTCPSDRCSYPSEPCVGGVYVCVCVGGEVACVSGVDVMALERGVCALEW